MVLIAYASGARTSYDWLFLDHLSEKNDVYVTTFDSNALHISVMPKEASELRTKLHLERIPDLMPPYIEQFTHGLYNYASMFFRSYLLKLCLRRIQPDVLIGCGGLGYGLYSALSGFKPFILLIWGSEVLVAPRYFFFRSIVKYALKKADAVVLTSKTLEEATIKLGCDPKKIVKFPWINLEYIISNIPDQTELRDKWTNNVVIISTRSHRPIYGLKYLIDAIPLVVNQSPEVRFILLGIGNLTSQLQKRTRDLGIENYVQFGGEVPIPKVIEYLKASDIYISTSLSDGLSKSLVEAMVVGLPVVLTDIPANREIIKNGENGLLIPTRDAKSISEALLSLINNTQLRKKLGENAAKTANKMFDWYESAKIFNQLLAEIAKRHRR